MRRMLPSQPTFSGRLSAVCTASLRSKQHYSLIPGAACTTSAPPLLSLPRTPSSGHLSAACTTSAPPFALPSTNTILRSLKRSMHHFCFPLLSLPRTPFSGHSSAVCAAERMRGNCAVRRSRSGQQGAYATPPNAAQRKAPLALPEWAIEELAAKGGQVSPQRGRRGSGGTIPRPRARR